MRISKVPLPGCHQFFPQEIAGRFLNNGLIQAGDFLGETWWLDSLDPLYFPKHSKLSTIQTLCLEIYDIPKLPLNKKKEIIAKFQKVNLCKMFQKVMFPLSQHHQPSLVYLLLFLVHEKLPLVIMATLRLLKVFHF